MKSSSPPASTTAATSARPGAVGTVPPAQVWADRAPVTTTAVAASARARACGARAGTTLAWLLMADIVSEPGKDP